MRQSDHTAHREPNPFSDDEEEVRRMLRQAGPRADVPERDLALIRAAARQEWLAMSRRVRGRRRRNLVIGLAAGLAVALGLWQLRLSGPPSAPTIEMATVKLLHGNATLRLIGDRTSRALVEGDALPVGATIETGPAGEPLPGVALRLAGGHSLRLHAGSRAVLREPQVVELLAGTLYLDAPTRPDLGDLTIVTALADVRHVGTQFEVHLADGDRRSLRVRIREGEVQLRVGERQERAQRGEELLLDEAGALERRLVPTHGPLWAWVEETAPAMAIEGVPLDEVLEWASRETGRRLTWDDSALRARAAEIILHGSIEGLSPFEALDVVLAGSRLGHRLQGDAIVVTAAGA